MLERTLFSHEHAAFRRRARDFIASQIVPHHREWERRGEVPRQIWRQAGDAGFLCCTIARDYGGLGLDYLYDVVFFEELARAGATAPGFMVHVDMVASYIAGFGTEAQKREWLPRMVRGEAIGALGITEPHAGSDVKAIRTRAVRDGDDFVINGQKVFISNGHLCDFVVLATKTDRAAGAKGVSLFLVEATRDGFVKGRKLPKLGLQGQDTAELFFTDVRVPASNLIGDEGRGFSVMMHKLAQERLAQAIRSAAVCESSIDQAISRLRERMGDDEARFLQHIRFKLAELATDTAAARAMTDRCIEQFMAGRLSPTDAAMAKMFVTTTHCKVVDECLQLIGESGYLMDSAIGRAYTDARIVRIAGGAIEVMKQIIGRELFPAERRDSAVPTT